MIHSKIIRAGVLELTDDIFHTHFIFRSADVVAKEEAGMTGGKKLDSPAGAIPRKYSSLKGRWFFSGSLGSLGPV
jgi:hypothetical protein